VSIAELNSATDFTSRVTFDGSKAVAGDKIVVSATNDGVALASQTVTLSANDITAGHIDVTFAKPADGQVQAVSANYVDAAGNAASDTAPTDSAKLDTTIPTVAITPLVGTVTGDTTVTFTLSEISNDFSLSSIDAVGGTLSNFVINSTRN
jgi:hypothetical protein